MMLLALLSTRIAEWATDRFGYEVLMDRRERAARLVEEAIELAQAEGVPDIRCINILRRVYARPVGEPKQEAGGVGVCWIAYCHAASMLPLSIVEEEVSRIEGLPAEVSRAKHDAKVAAGLAMPGKKAAP